MKSPLGLGLPKSFNTLCITGEVVCEINILYTLISQLNRTACTLIYANIQSLANHVPSKATEQREGRLVAADRKCDVTTQNYITFKVI